MLHGSLGGRVSMQLHCGDILTLRSSAFATRMSHDIVLCRRDTACTLQPLLRMHMLPAAVQHGIPAALDMDA